MSMTTNKPPLQIEDLRKATITLKQEPSIQNAQIVVERILSLLGVAGGNNWKPFNDSNGKIKANAHWFMDAEGFADRRATYKVAEDNKQSIDIKAFWTKKTTKSVMSWLVALTPNFEDEPFYTGLNVGIDFVIPEKADRVIILLSKNYIIRTLEVSGDLSVTQQEIFAKWLQSFDFTNKRQVHEILWQSFDIEPLNKKFYKEISSFFIELKDYLVKAQVFDDKHAAYFVNRLIGRLVFCWFLDKKGIINEEAQYFSAAGLTGTQYYREKLEVLFFKVFNTIEEEREPGVERKTPFLNGGLFDPKQGDKYGDSTLEFPADYFERLIGFLHHYNFTTDESTSTFQQVAIDPEMLGRIFENLLAEQSEETGEQARKAKGAFYTPREIVDYMCRESLKEYLKSKLPPSEDAQSHLDKLISSKEHEWRDQQKNYREKMKAYKYDILEALDDFKVLDPACGSGAFPMGILSLLTEVYERLDPTFDPYKKKLEIIKNTIYGVDIEPMAVEISRLRAWLSIVVDEQKIEPLPNLDFKFVCANTLIPLNEDVSLFDNEGLKEKMQEIREKFYNARSKGSKVELKRKFEKLLAGGQQSMFSSNKEAQLKTYHPFDSENTTEFFDSEFMFGVIGFDVVIGNPPYVQLQKDQGRLAKMFEKVGYKTFARTGDIYSLFYERGTNLLKQGGYLCFITSNKWMRAGYGETLRKFFAEDTNPMVLLDFAGQKIFESATVDTNILLLSKKVNQYKTLACIVKTKEALRSLSDFVRQTGNICSFNNADSWVILSNIEQRIKEKIERTGTPLKDWDVQINYGIKTGFNEAFIINGAKRKELIAQDPKSDEIIRPILRGRDIKRYVYDFADLWLINTHNGTREKGVNPVNVMDYPAIKKHLDGFWKNIEKRVDQGNTPYNLRNCAYMEDFSKQKIVWARLMRVSRSEDLSFPRFSLVPEGMYTVDSLCFITGKHLDYLTHLLNSKVAAYYFFSNIAILDNGGMQMRQQYIEKFPIPSFRTLRKEDISDELIFSLYEFDKIEIEFIDQFLATKYEEIKNR